MPQIPPYGLLAMASVLTALSQTAPTQCGFQLLASGHGYGVTGQYAVVRDVTWWDPDGQAGPRRPRIVFAGDWSSFHGILAGNLIAYDPDNGTWSTFDGSNMFSTVEVVASMPDGALIVGGNFQFTNGSGATVKNIARWDGSGWQPLGGGVSHAVYALAPLANGDLIAGGFFTSAGGTPANRIARWDGTSWHALGAGAQTAGQTQALAVSPTGELVASFLQLGVYRWDGASWNPLGASPNAISDLVFAANGDLYASSDSTGNAQGLSRWDGTSWHNLHSGVFGAIAVLGNGDLAAAGDFGTGSQDVRTFDGATWVSIGQNQFSTGSVRAMVPHGDDGLVAGGTFWLPQTPGGRFLGYWDGNTWSSALGFSLNAAMDQLHVAPDGRILAIEASSQSLLEWSGMRWRRTPDFVGVPSQFGTLLGSLTFDAGGSPIVGSYASPGKVGRWTGSSWQQLGNAFPNGVEDVACLPNGDLIACGRFPDIYRWNGTGWASIAAANAAAVVNCLQVTNAGLLVGGDFQTIAGVPCNRLALWDGTAWSDYGQGISQEVVTLQALSDGDVLAGQRYGAVLRRAQSGGSWQQVASASGAANQMVELPNGDVLIARANGVDLQRLSGVGVSVELSASSVQAVALRENGELLVGGNFLIGGNQPSASLAVLAPSCPSTVATIPTPCVASAGAIELTARTRAWAGSDLRTEASGFATNAFAVAVLGLSPQQLPLQSLVTAALPACDLLAAPDLLTVTLPSLGTAQYDFAIPNNPALAGTELYQQFAQFDLGPPYEVSSSNGLRIVVGAL